MTNTNTVPSRPTTRDERVLRLAAEDLFADLQRTFGDEDFDHEGSVISIANAIKYEDDAYRICRNLDNDGWDCDAEMVEIMGSAAAYKASRLQTLVTEWVRNSNVAPPMEIGTAVTFTRRGGKQRGVISAVHSSTAEYIVFCEDLGHVKEGIGTHGCIVQYESCERAED